MSTGTERYLTKLEETNLLMNKELTFTEYADQIVKFQEILVKQILDEEYKPGMRLDAAIYKLDSLSREKGFSNNQKVKDGLSALKIINKEVAITLSGKRGEDLVARTLEFVTRPDFNIYRNVYVSNENDETELDDVILTNSGIIILEVKNIKENVKISEEGRLLHSNDECYDHHPLCERMREKRNMLRNKLELIMNEKNLDIPIKVESFIVFSTPTGSRFDVYDYYRKEKWCYRTGLKNKLDYYIGLASYNKNQLETLNQILEKMETQVKRFEPTVNYDDLRLKIADMMAFFDNQKDTKEDIESNKNVEDVVKDIKHILDFDIEKKKYKKIASIMGATAATLAGISVLGTTLFVMNK